MTLQIKLAAVPEAEDGFHLVKLFTTKGFVGTVKIVNRCVAILAPQQDIQSNDITDIQVLENFYS